MILSLFLILMLIVSLMTGFRRGFVLQAVHIVGLIISFMAAWLYYEAFAELIRLWVPFLQLPEESPWPLLNDALGGEMVYYNGIAFVLIFIVVKIITQIIGSMLDFIGNLPILNVFNSWLGAALGFIEGLVIMAILLHLAALIQVEFVQQLLHSSSIAQWIFNYTPIVSNELRELWIEGTRE
ncbi:CvpA family protein [Alkalicoccus halolimnae]|uniref:CvpA family protein n=1 Tax=Alkalicoccus halolimnae TaxID=1667239 RepID=A0AAJ8LTT7_9BACI|nr:CvpA family protein [Alkalicoccus halolimnae]